MSGYDGSYEAGRLRRAAVRAVKRIGQEQFVVAGNDEPIYYVDLEAEIPCTCADAEYRGRGCLHELASRLHCGDMKLINALGQMLLQAEKARGEDE